MLADSSCMHLATELPAELAASEASDTGRDVSSACKLCSAGNFTTRKADEFQRHQGCATGQQHADRAGSQSAERRRVGEQLDGYR